MSLKDLPLVGAFGATGALVVDVVVHSGDYLLVAILLALESAPLLVPFAASLERLAERIPFLPADTLGYLTTAALVLLVLAYGVRLYRSIAQNDEN